VTQVLQHASCVAINGRALLIKGPSGSGKSGLALQLMGFGARLVADDQTLLQRDGDRIVASCPTSLFGLIEARGMGILRTESAVDAEVVLVVDLAEICTDRMPPPRHCDILGLPVDLVTKVEAGHFAPALICLLSHGRHA
jgi:HPr kinase/phosphorylase